MALQTSRRRVGWAVLAVLPVLMGLKCFDHDPDLGGAAAEGSFVECSDPETAEIQIQNFAYNNICGCQEERGSRSCTVPTGTRVIWTFADSEDHNVQSLEETFGVSADMTTGTFDYVFNVEGTYEYRCSLHPDQMSGYSVRAEGAAAGGSNVDAGAETNDGGAG